MRENKKIIRINPDRPQAEPIKAAGEILEKGGVVVFPATCLYGIAVNAFNQDAVEAVFKIKQRPPDNPVLVLIEDRTQMLDIVASVPDSAVRLMDAVWPGSLTLVFEAKSHIPERLTAGTGKIGIRVPAHPAARALVRQVGFPITGTSANLSGKPGCQSIPQLDSRIIQQADLILDAGTLKGGTGSTIVDVTAHPPEILRQGEVSREKIHTILAH